MVRCISLISALLCVLSMTAQTDFTRESALQLGAGGVRQQDTYLSPQSYKGQQLVLTYETLHMTHYCKERLSFHTITQGDFTNARNWSGTSREYGGRLSFDCGWHYNWFPVQGLRLLAGGMMGFDAGVVYNERNGNNPAQARVNANLSASFIGMYDFRIRSQRLSVRYEANMPFVGVMFSPKYGQSYYEISEFRSGGNARVTYPGNAFTLWQKLSVDIPVGSLTMRFSYLSDIRQSHVNSIKVHDWTNAAMIGFVWYYKTVRKP